MSPAQYIMELRFTEAVRQLKEGSLPVEEVMQQCGFPDRTRFYRLFRERTGMTPAKYGADKRSARNSHNNKTEN